MRCLSPRSPTTVSASTSPPWLSTLPPEKARCPWRSSSPCCASCSGARSAPTTPPSASTPSPSGRPSCPRGWARRSRRRGSPRWPRPTSSATTAGGRISPLSGAASSPPTPPSGRGRSSRRPCRSLPRSSSPCTPGSWPTRPSPTWPRRPPPSLRRSCAARRTPRRPTGATSTCWPPARTPWRSPGGRRCCWAAGRRRPPRTSSWRSTRRGCSRPRRGGTAARPSP
mmetsp:Transcript_26619/g.67127  ORF Transcript_26619/g.67127 Transcript_26619/m.67127 type:complete len:226 (+) Transcript_26619:200-877(+)